MLKACRDTGIPFVTTYHGAYSDGSRAKRLYNSVMTRGARVIAASGFIAELVLNDAQLSRLVLSDQATDEERKTIGTGRVTASLSLRQTFGAQAV